MIIDIFKAFAVGVAASVPMGPIAILVIQKTLSKGFNAGYVTSLGSTVVDTVFAILSVFALSYVQEFIEGNSIPIFIGGGVIVIVLGLSMMFSDPFRKKKKRLVEPGEKLTAKMDPSATDFLQACLMGFSNPGAIAVIFALMAFFGIAEGQPSDWSYFPIILGVALGSTCYWIGITALINKFRKQFKMNTVVWINRIMGALVIVLGLATLAEGLMRFFK